MSTATRGRRRKPVPTRLTPDEIAAAMEQWDPLAHKWAGRWFRTYRGVAPYADFHAEARLGMLIAARRFDPSRGFLFSTYSCWWIRQQLQRFVAAEVNRGLHVPETHHRAAGGTLWLPIASIQDAGGPCESGDEWSPDNWLADHRGEGEPPTPTDWGHVLKAIGERLGGVTKERARQIVARAVRKLRAAEGLEGELEVVA